jgi:hypothetical protein
MAEEGKQSITIKAMAYLAGGFFVVLVSATKLLDTYFEMTLLPDAKVWLLGVWDWLLLETAMPNWSLLMITVALTSIVTVAFYYYRTADEPYSELHEIERKIYKTNNPQFPRLTDNQTLLMEALAYHANFRKVANLDSICKLVSLGKLEVEDGLKQLQVKRLVRQKVTRGTFGATIFELTLAGKDYALERLELT